jgi:hypothetical protein
MQNPARDIAARTPHQPPMEIPPMLTGDQAPNAVRRTLLNPCQTGFSVIS